MATLEQRLVAFAQRVRDQFNTIKPRLMPSGGLVGQVLKKTTAADYAADWADETASAGGGLPTLAARFYSYTDCLYPVANTVDNGHQYLVSGTAAAWTSLPADGTPAVGVVRLALGTTATGRGAIACPDAACIRLGLGATSFEGQARLVALSSTTTTYTVRLGLLDSVTAEPVDGVFFRYSHGLNGGRWQAVCRTNNIETVADTGVLAAAGAWLTFEVNVNAAGTAAVFRIDGLVVATLGTNLPNVLGRETSFGLTVIRSVGTAAFSAVDVDYLETELLFTTPR